MTELRLAVRRLAARPAAAVASIVTLACAIGASAATWSLLSSVLLRPLPVRDPSSLFAVERQDLITGFTSAGIGYPEYRAIRRSGVFAGVAASSPLVPSLPVAGAPRRALVVSYDYFDALGVPLSIGRPFREEEDRRGAPLVAILSHRLWQTAYSGDISVLGKEIAVGKTQATVVGIAETTFRGLDLSSSPDIYLPLHAVSQVGYPSVNYFADARQMTSPTAFVTIVGRLRPGTTAAETVQPLENVLRGNATMRPQLTNVNAAAIPWPARAGMRQFSGLLGVTVALLLLIGCTTVGILLLVRTESRREEFAMCLALGASRARLARGVIVEGAVLAACGFVLAAPVASWLFSGLRTFQLPGGVSIGNLNLSVDLRSVAAAGAAAASAVLLIAIAAGTFGFSANVADALRSHSGSTPMASRRRARALLVATQVAIAMTLLTGAGLFARSLVRALQVNTAVDASRLLTATFDLSPPRYSAVQREGFINQMKERLRNDLAVRSVAIAASDGGMGAKGSLVIDGEQRQVPSFVPFLAVDDDYFQTLGLTPRAGRLFGPDHAGDESLVAVISASFATFITGNGTGRALGARIRMPFSRNAAEWPVLKVVGIVPDVIDDVSRPAPLAVYMPLRQHPSPMSPQLVLTARADAMDTAREVTAAARSLDPQLRPGVTVLRDQLAHEMLPQQFGGFVLGVLGAVALMLTLLGTYVLAESAAVLRTREMGIRAALGATRAQLTAIVLGETARLVGMGVIAGGLLAWTQTRLIRSFLFRVDPLDPPTVATVTALLLALSAAVSIRPALRAARVDLAQILKSQ